jgi:hypothetical protein
MIRAFAVLMNLDKASMGVNRNTCLAGPIDRRHLKTLTYGQFYGVIEQRHELHRFSVSLVAANDISIMRKKHSHDSAHIILILEGQYISAPPRLEHLDGRKVIRLVEAMKKEPKLTDPLSSDNRNGAKQQNSECFHIK